MRQFIRRISIILPMLCCGAASAAAADNAAWPPEHMKDLPADYVDRIRQSLAVSAERLDRLDESKSILTVRFRMPGLVLRQRVEEINKLFESDKFDYAPNPKFGFSLFSTDYVRLYGLFNSRTGSMKGRLSQKAQATFEKEFWRIAKSNSKLAEARRGVWDMEGSENHHLASKASDFLVAQFLRNISEYANEKYDDGSTLNEQYEVRRAYWMKWFDERAKRGQFVEAASTSYQGASISALFNLRDFAEDPVLRKKADMYLDLTYANIAEETLLTTRGGPKSRVKLGHEYDAGMIDRGYDLIFNAPGRAFVAVPDNTRSTSNYYPAPVIVNLAKDTSGRGSYSFAKRWPGPVAAGGGRKAASADGEEPTLWRTLNPEWSVLRYGFATPNYVIGSASVDPSWTDDMSMGFRWQGIVFAKDPIARIGFEVEPKITKGWHGFNPFIGAQDRNVMITQKWAPVPPNPKSANLRVYFSPTLDDVQEDGGWIFAKAGDAFSAVKVVDGGYTWTPSWKHGDTLTKDNKSFITLNSEVPVITVVNDASDYNHDFTAFKAAVKKQPVQYSGGVVQFATIKFSGISQPPQINGKDLNLAPPRGYDSPFIRSDWNSGLIYIRKGNDTEILDFRDPNNPVKTVGAPVTPEFPPGVGQDKPIVFGMN